MKFLRGLGVFLINLLLLVLIICLSLVIRTKNFLEKEVVHPLVKEILMVEAQDTEFTEEQRTFVEKITNEKEFDVIVDRIIQNFLDYETKDNYELSKGDYDIAINFILKYKDELNKLSSTKYTEKEIRELLNYEDAKKIVKEAFDSMEKETDTNVIGEIAKAYVKVTATETIFAIVGAIIVCILLIMLVSWSLITWMLVTGIDLIISGGLFALIFGIGGALLNSFASTINEETISVTSAISFNGFIIMAVIEIIVGIVFIVVYNIIKKANKNAEVTPA